MRGRSWDKGLRVLFSAALVAGLVPAPALAEMLPAEAAEAVEQEEAPAAEEVEQAATEEQAAPEQEPADVTDEVPEKAAEVITDDIELTAQAEVSPVEMTLDEEITASADEGGYWLGVFTAPEDGFYTFKSLDDDTVDPFGLLYADTDLDDCLAESDDDGEGTNFSISYMLQAGETVYLKVREISDGVFACPVQVRAGRDPIELSDLSRTNQRDDYAYTGEPIDYEFIGFDDGGIDYELVMGTDYEFAGFRVEETDEVLTDAPSEIGSYYAIYQAVEGSGYQGTYEALFRIVDSYDLTNAEWWFAFDARDMYNEEAPYLFLYQGKPIEPKPQVTLDEEELVEGRDYTVSYEDNAAVTAEGGPYGKIVITGCEPYHGELVTSFQIVESIPLSLLFANGVILRYADESESYYEGDGPVQYLQTGAAITPIIDFPGDVLTYATRPVEGADYKLTYCDAEGTPVALPKDAGSYQVVMEGLEGGSLSGTYAVPFDIVESLELNQDNTEINLSYDGSYTRDYDWDEETDTEFPIFYLADFVDDAKGFLWNLWSAGSSLVEGLDYTVSAVLDTVTNWWEVTFTGTGSYTGSAQANVRGAESISDVFLSKTAVGGAYRRNYVAFDADGNLQVVGGFTLSDLTRGVDYEIVGAIDNEEDENVITSAEVGEEVVVKLRGLGIYEGCESVVFADVANSQIDFAGESGPGANVTVRGVAYGYDEDGNLVTYLLRSLVEKPEVAVSVYAQRYVALEEGEGFTVSTAVTGDSATISVSSDESSKLFSGTKDIDVTLVDSYDIAKLVDYVYVTDAEGGYVDYHDGKAGGRLSATGFTYVPTVYTNGHPTYDVQVLDASGTQVAGISKAGSYTLRLVGTGSWSGQLDVPITVEASKTQNKLPLDSCAYDIELATAATPQPKVTLSAAGHTFAEGTDYTLTYGPNTKAGDKNYVKIVATDDGGLIGAKSFAYVIAADAGTNLAKGYRLYVQLPNDGDFVTTGNLVKPFALGAKPAVEVRTKSTGDVLDASSYDVTYGNNEAEGLAWVKVTGKGSYSGSLGAEYYIMGLEQDNRQSLEDAVITVADQTWTGEELTPVVTVKLGDTTLRQGDDFTVAYQGNVNVGVATVTITGAGDYRGTASQTFKINKASQQVSAADLTVTYGDTATLEVAAEGALTFESADSAIAAVDGAGVVTGAAKGTTTITVKAAETDTYLAGTATAKVTVEPRGVGDLDVVVEDQTYAFGAELTPEVSVARKGTALVAGTDFEVGGYDNNVDAGTAHVTVKGIGNYTGEVAREFQIEPYQIADADVSAPDQTFTGAALEPVTVVADGHTLTSGTDYTVTYANNTGAGQATATVQGVGNFAGEVVKEFTINKAAQTIVAADRSVAVGGTTDLGATVEGGVLAYQVADESIATVSDTGTVTGTVAGKTEVTITAPASDNYLAAEPVTVTITVSSPNIEGKAQVTLAETSYVYDGEAKEPAVTVTLDGATLVEGTDYTLTYANNTDAGTAKAVVKAAGGYTGTIETSFTIAKAKQVITASNKNVKVKKSVSLGAKALGGAKLSYSQSKSSKKIATVDKNGKVKATKSAKAGKSVTITISAAETKNYTAAKKTVKVYVKAANTMSAKGKTATVKASATKKKAQTVKGFTVSKAKGSVSVSNVSTNATAKKFKVAKSGKVTVPKGTKKGTYTVKVKVTAKGNGSYLSASKTINVKVKVK